MRERWREGPPWRDHPGGRRGRHDGPGGAVVAAGLFHFFGARSQIADGGVYRPMDLLLWAILLAGPLALAWRRRAPIVVLAVTEAGFIAFATVATPRWTYAVAPLIALFTAVKAGRRTPAVLTATVGYLGYVAVTRWAPDGFGVPADARPELRAYLLAGAALLLTVLIGGAAKVQSEQMAERIKARAEQARVREEQERRQASEERLRIARELHDVLGHHLSLINVQAGVGLHLMDAQPQQAREALSAIKTASAEALREVRAVLGVLRPEEEAAPRQPALGLDRLADLTAGAGLPVVTTIRGVRRDLPAEVDRAAYRIVQEALTNVRRHAPAGASAEVVAEYTPVSLRLSVRNDVPVVSVAASPKPSRLAGLGLGGSPPAPEPGPAGSGVTGMRARAETLGGTLSAEPLPSGGFLVEAVLPTPTEKESV